jgi:hypothetical protein
LNPLYSPQVQHASLSFIDSCCGQPAEIPKVELAKHNSAVISLDLARQFAPVLAKFQKILTRAR